MDTPPKNPKILIVEDDPFISGLLVRRLADSNFKIHHAADTEAAYAALKDGSIDLVLLDIMLPGVDGLTFLSHIKSMDAWKSLPVIIISNFGQQEYVEKARNAGALDYIVKANSSPDEIVEKIKAHIS